MKMKLNQAMFAVWMAGAAGGCGQADSMTEVPGEEPVRQSIAAVTGTRLTLNAGGRGINGNTYNFAANTWPLFGSAVPMGDMAFHSGQFLSWNALHRGVANLGPCNDLAEFPDWLSVAYAARKVAQATKNVPYGFDYRVSLVPGNCYAVRTIAPNAGYGVVQIGSVSTASVSLVFRYITTWLKSASLNARTANQPVSFSFSNEATSTQHSVGDWRLTADGFFKADSQEHGWGLIDAGGCDDVSMTHGAFPMQYWPDLNAKWIWHGVKVHDSHCYFALTPGNMVYLFMASSVHENLPDSTADEPPNLISITYAVGGGKQL